MLEAASKCLPLMFVLFLPILFSATTLCLDDRAGLTARQHWYLNTPAWIGRWLVYFAIWIGLTLILTSRGDTQDSPRPPSRASRD